MSKQNMTNKLLTSCILIIYIINIRLTFNFEKLNSNAVFNVAIVNKVKDPANSEIGKSKSGWNTGMVQCVSVTGMCGVESRGQWAAVHAAASATKTTNCTPPSIHKLVSSMAGFSPNAICTVVVARVIASHSFPETMPGPPSLTILHGDELGSLYRLMLCFLE